MRAFACVLGASLALTGDGGGGPVRVASLNLCTDELLLMLAAPQQIVSVTHLAQPARRDSHSGARRGVIR